MNDYVCRQDKLDDFVRRPLCIGLGNNVSNIFSSDTTGPIKAKFHVHVEPPWAGGT